MNSLLLLEILIAVGGIVIIYSLARDMITKRKKAKDVSTKESFHHSRSSITLTLQLQAYERLVVLLERISPEQLVHRLGKIDMPAAELYAVMMQDIREEFAHNVSQQIYVSDIAWDAVVHAKEYVIGQLNLILGQLPPDARSRDLCKQLLTQHLQQQTSPLKIALDVLRKEAKKLM
ncbi:MAG: hypothetical protein K6T34_04100 [Thermoflavifilum sp.]|nr:hypothetical protein [Thermoflavifilum sp.]